jgi:cytochrome P450 family 26 subfamily A
VNRIRAALLAFLRRDALQHYTGFVDATLARFFDADQLHQLAHENISDINMPATCISLKLFPLMKQLIFSITCRLLFGGGASNMDDDDDDDHHLRTLQLLSSFNTMAKGLLHLPINFPGTRYRRALVAADAIRAQLQGWIDKRRRL